MKFEAHLTNACTNARDKGLLRIAISWIWILAASIMVTPGLASHAFAVPNARAEISPQSGQIQDLFILTVTFEDAGGSISPQVQTSADFDVQYIGPRSITRIINGTVSSQQSFVYQVTPKREGNLQTPQVRASVNGQEIVAPSLTVVVSGGAPSTVAPATVGDSLLFMSQTATPQSAFVGQQVVNSLSVYTRITVQGVSFDDAVADGFWQEKFPQDRNFQRTVNGREYSGYEVSRALFPLRPGKLTVPLRRAVAKTVVVTNNDPFRGFDPFNTDIFQQFFQTKHVRDVPLEAPEISISIEPLPPVPPEMARFSGGVTVVGGTSIASQSSDVVIGVGESKNISITVTSDGNLNPLNALPLAAPEGVKIYDGQAHIKHDTRGGRLLTHKTFSYTVVPLRGGAVRIPGAALLFFDPEARTYKLASTPDFGFLVSGDTNSSSQSAMAPDAIDQPIDTESSQPVAPTETPRVAPPLQYDEPSLMERVTERISIQFALLVVAATIAMLSLGALIRGLQRASAPRRAIALRLAHVSEMGDFEALVREWAVEHLPGATPTSTFDELRVLARAKISDRATSTALISVLDDVELHRYGQGSSTTLAEIKKRFAAALETAPR